MVDVRNIYLDYIRSDDKLKKFEYTVIWDFDIDGVFYRDGVGMSGYYFKHGVTTPSGGTVTINGMCANGAGSVKDPGSHADPMTSSTYYDPYAHKEIGERPAASGNTENLHPEDCSSDGEIRQVQSCFNGFMIYRSSALDGKRYSLEKDDDGNAICEHVVLHKSIPGIYINSSMLFVIGSSRSSGADDYSGQKPLQNCRSAEKSPLKVG
jgi:hypothetical protein